MPKLRVRLEPALLTEPLDELVLTPFYPHQSSLSPAEFRARFGRARLLDGDDPLLAAWQYAPWYSGSFSTPAGRYDFSLYLGGLGCLDLPDGRQGFFLLK